MAAYERVILHIDANNFYASVSLTLHPELRGKPLAVAGDPERRHGIILAKSQEAKKFNITTGEQIWVAKQKCPDLILVPPDYELYVEYSEKLFAIYTQYTDRVESFGLDECWLDCTESVKLYGDGKTIADTIRRRVREELGITVSVGVSFTKIFAKLGSDYKKPDATTVLDLHNYRYIVWRLPVKDLLMVGRSTAKTLERMNIRTIGDLARTNPEILQKRFGIIGPKLHAFANGRDDDDVAMYYSRRIPESVGNGTTVCRDLIKPDEITAVMYSLSDMIATRLRRHELRAQGVRLSLRFNDLSYISKQQALLFTTDTAEEICDAALNILNNIYSYVTPLRAITIHTYKLTRSDCVQLNMMVDTAKNDKLNGIIDDLRAKYGYSIIKRAITQQYDDLCCELVDSHFHAFKKTEGTIEEGGDSNA